MENKKYCQVHHFFYSSKQCPFCQEDKLSKIAKKNDKKAEEKKTMEEKLEQLKNKFNTKK